MILYANKARSIIDEVQKAVKGKQDCIEKVMTAILAGGHILLDDVPGVGKTTMAMAFAKAMGLVQNRVQFTPDVMPSDITGFSIYQKDLGKFFYQQGAIMCNLFLADEINRTSPKTQSALLQVMEENSVTVDSVTRSVPQPFIVIATQNPAGSYGTQMLPESQLDRFMICTTMGYPDISHEIELIRDRGSGNQWDVCQSVVSAEELVMMRREAEGVYAKDIVYQYMAELTGMTREHPLLDMGVSPRGTIALSRMSKARAYLRGREFVLPDDVTAVASDVMSHRVILGAKARAAHTSARQVVEEIIQNTPKPSPGR